MKLAKTYEPSQYETDIYAIWEKSGAFKPSGKGEPFCIVMPPPNANGNLHIGHAYTVGLEDIMTRYYRMCGRDTIYIPGADHAGFETWVVYERALTEKGMSRFDFNREQLYSQVWNFVAEQRGNMELQLRALGASCDWDSLVFTLDEKVVKTAYQTFKKLWEEGLVYRGERIVNYCTNHQTSFADIEVDHKNEKSKLWQIAYKFVDSDDEIIVATTRPETIMGDVAIAVNPNDARHQNIIGKEVIVPLTDRKIPIIADDYVDMAFGTGALKITPAHDPNDFEIGQRHNLTPIQVIGYDGLMTNVPDRYVGKDIDTARQMILEELDNAGLRRGEEAIEHSVGHCYKCGTVIEPMIKDQWFLKIQPLAQRAKKALLNGDITFTPDSRKRILVQYLDNLRDWNLSRQIAWGIPIPAFQNIEDDSDWIFDTRVGETTLEIDGKIYRRDEDTFDTWFSSGQWPFITTDVVNGGDLSRFYSTSVMETGTDLLDRWVARMIMLGLYVTDKVPFKHVYLHGMVLDAKGQKMSKSKKNVINPMDTIGKFGSDALRIGLISNRSASQNQAFGLERVVSGRNFCNKLWNIARFIESKVDDDTRNHQPEPGSLADHWIVEQLNKTITKVSKQIETYRFAEAAETVYHAIWDDVADWYIESSKLGDNAPLMAWVLDTCLKITHPFAPFVTETIWQTLPLHDDLLITSKWPEKLHFDQAKATEFNKLKKLVNEIRFVTSEMPGNDKYNLLYKGDSLIADNTDLIKKLAKLADVQPVDTPRGLRLANSGRQAWLDISAKALADHETNLQNRLAEAEAQIENLQNRLANESYIKKAPAKLVEESKLLLQQRLDLRDRLIRELEVIK